MCTYFLMLLEKSKVRKSEVKKTFVILENNFLLLTFTIQSHLQGSKWNIHHCIFILLVSCIKPVGIKAGLAYAIEKLKWTV